MQQTIARFLRRTALSNRMVEDISRHNVLGDADTAAHQTHIKDNSTSTAKLMVPSLAAHNRRTKRGGVTAVL
jgi:hypothetical protein